MKGSWFFVLSAAIPAILSAATHTVKVNADGSFSPPVVVIAGGDTVEWTFSSPADSIIGASAPSCSAIRAYLPAGFPLINEAGDYEKPDGTSSGGKLPGGT